MWKTRLVIMGLIAILFSGLGVLIGFILPRLPFFPSGAIRLNTATILREVKTLSQLVSVKYVLEKVVVMEDVRWYGESRVLMVAHGVVKAGVDLSKLAPGDIVIRGTNITLKLPPAEITDVYLDDKQTSIVERSTGVLRQFDKQLEQNARRQAVEDLRRAARYNGILKDAEERAQVQLENLFRQLGVAITCQNTK